MNASLDLVRRMVPRWRDSSRTTALGELSGAGPVMESHVPPLIHRELAHLVAEFDDDDDYGHAADLVSAASLVAIPELPESVVRAAHKVLECEQDDYSPASTLARRLLSGGSDIPDSMLKPPHRDRVRALRSSLRRYPLTPFGWVDLSLAYVEVGSREKAVRAMRVAVGLAPNDRFVLRSFTRLALHLRLRSDFALAEEASRRLRSSPATVTDPWLAAAEIACAMVLERTPKTVRSARGLLSRDVSPFHLGELAASLGALEVENGAIKSGTRLLASALAAPTDNSIAQVAWTSRLLKRELLAPRFLEQELTFEARAWGNYQAGRWRLAISEAEKWWDDEPFASRPVHMATFIAAVPLADYGLVVELAQKSLALNPHDPLTRNNLAFALASLDRPAEARSVLRLLRGHEIGADTRVALTATAGLISLRLGEVEAGRALYRAAIEAAVRARDVEGEVLASLYLAREEARLGLVSAADSLSNAAKLLSRTPRSYLSAVYGQIVALRRSTALPHPHSLNPHT